MTVQTAGKSAELAIFRMMAGHAPVMLWIAGTDGNCISVNQACLDFTGLTMAEVQGIGWADALHPDDRRRAIDTYKRALASRQPFQMEYRFRRADGEFRLILDRRVPWHDENGFAGYIGSADDVTETRDAKNALRDSEQRFRLLAENAQDVIYRYRLDPQPCAEYVSPASRVILGYTPEEFYADPDLSLKVVHPEDRGMVARIRRSPGEFGEPVRLRWCRPDGNIAWIEHRNVPVYSDDGRLVALEGIGRDITASLAAEEQLRASEAQLRDLTGRLQTAREQERADLARELHDELGQTLTSLKLELARTTTGLARHAVDPQIIDRLQSLVGLIDLSTETVRRISTALRPPALDHLGLPAAIELEAAAVQRRTGIRCRVAQVPGPILLDAERSTTVFRIFQEALTNVVRHAHASAVGVRLQQTVKSFRLRVQDNGRGISRLELSNPKSIGLLGMRERAQKFGGQIEIVGQRGKGTTLTVMIPLPTQAKARRRHVRGATIYAARASRR